MESPKNPYEGIPFAHLCTARNEDHRQDQYLAMLEGQPKTEAEALAVLKTLHYRHERAQRNDSKRAVQLVFDSRTTEAPDEGELLELVSFLSAKDRELVEAHVLHEQTFEMIAAREGVSRMAICKRYAKAKARLSELYAEHYPGNEKIVD